MHRVTDVRNGLPHQLKKIRVGSRTVLTSDEKEGAPYNAERTETRREGLKWGPNNTRGHKPTWKGRALLPQKG